MNNEEQKKKSHVGLIIGIIVGVLVFLGITAYDMQKLKRYATIGTDNLAILGALDLYLDFINIFIKLLNLFGKRRD